MNLALTTTVTRKIPTVVVKEIIENSDNLIFINDYDGPNNKPHIFLNGILMGITLDPHLFIDEMKAYRENGLLDSEISFTYNDGDIRIFCDEGRLVRPLLTVNESTNRLNISESDNVSDWDKLVENQFIQYVDNSEIQNCVIAMDDSDLVKHNNDFAEICPAMMLGVMANTIPFCDHNQCIFEDEKVYLANGSFKLIKDIVVGDKVITFNPKNQKQSYTTVTHTYTNKTDKQCFTITTVTGRKITATYDHRFMTSEGWVRLENLNNKLIGISLEPIPLENNKKEYIKIDLYKFYDNELPILARIFGYTFNYKVINDRNNYSISLQFDSDNDSKNFDNDVNFLNIHFDKIKENNKYIYSGDLPHVIHNLREYDAVIPDWVLYGSDSVKREFMASSLINNPTIQIKNITNINILDYTFTNDKIFGITENDLLFINYFDTVGIRYRYKTFCTYSMISEYLKYIKYNANDNYICVPFRMWKNKVIIKEKTIFIPIHSIVKSNKNIICDITVEKEDYQSFICGDAFCVHNSPRNIYQASMG